MIHRVILRQASTFENNKIQITGVLLEMEFNKGSDTYRIVNTVTDIEQIMELRSMLDWFIDNYDETDAALHISKDLVPHYQTPTYQ